MKPLNQKERRNAFWKFTLLFFLSVVPICVAIFLYGKIDKTENNFLRSNYQKQGDIDSEKSNKSQYYEDIIGKTSDLQKYLIDNKAYFAGRQDYGSIENKINAFETELNNFNSNVRSKNTATEADSVLYKIAALQVVNLRNLNKIYENTSNEIKKLDENIADTKEELQKCQSKLN